MQDGCPPVPQVAAAGSGYETGDEGGFGAYGVPGNAALSDEEGTCETRDEDGDDQCGNEQKDCPADLVHGSPLGRFSVAFDALLLKCLHWGVAEVVDRPLLGDRHRPVGDLRTGWVDPGAVAVELLQPLHLLGDRPVVGELREFGVGVLLRAVTFEDPAVLEQHGWLDDEGVGQGVGQRAGERAAAGGVLVVGVLLTLARIRVEDDVGDLEGQATGSGDGAVLLAEQELRGRGQQRGCQAGDEEGESGVSPSLGPVPEEDASHADECAHRQEEAGQPHLEDDLGVQGIRDGQHGRQEQLGEAEAEGPGDEPAAERDNPFGDHEAELGDQVLDTEVPVHQPAGV